mgnify:CR=1 FL=1
MHDCSLWFKKHVLERLMKLDRMAFASFFYIPQFVESLADLTIIDDMTWWKGLVGNQLRRSPDDIRQLNCLDETIRNQHIQLQIHPGDLHKLQTQAPVPIQDMHELLFFLQRVDACSSCLFPQSYTGALARAIHDKLLHNGQHNKLAKDSGWMSRKPK